MGRQRPENTVVTKSYIGRRRFIEALRGTGDWPEVPAELRAFPCIELGKPRDPRDFNRLGAKQRQYPFAIRHGPSSAFVMSRRGWPGSLQTSHTSRHRRSNVRYGPVPISESPAEAARTSVGARRPPKGAARRHPGAAARRVHPRAIGQRIVLCEEGLRGDNVRTASRAIERWRSNEVRDRNELVVVRDIRISKHQPRPMTRDHAGTGG